MKRLIVHLVHPTEPDRVDRVVIPEGVTLRDTSDARNRPFIPIGSIVRVELRDDEASAVAPTPDPPPENEMRTPHFVPVYVRTSAPAALTHEPLRRGVGERRTEHREQGRLVAEKDEEPDQRRHHEVDPEHPPAAGADEHRGVGEDAPDDESADRHGNEQGTEKQEQPHCVSLSLGIESLSAHLGSGSAPRLGALPLGEEPDDAA